MPVSRFDNPAEYRPVNTFQSEFVEMPFQEINYALASRQKKKDDEFGDIQAKQNALNIDALAEHSPSREAFVEQYNKKFMDLLDSGIDPTSGEFVRQKKMILDELSKDRRPGTFKRAIEARKKEIENEEELKKAGTWREYNRATQWQNGSPLDEDGNPNELIYQGAYRGEDQDAFWHNIFEKKKADAVKNKVISSIDPETGAIIFTTEGDKGVYEGSLRGSIYSKDKNGREVNNINNYLSSASGQDFIRMLKSANPNITQQEVAEAAYQKAESLMKSYLYNESEDATDLEWMPKYAFDAAEQAKLDSQAPEMWNPATPNPYQGEALNINFNADGTISNEYSVGNDGNSTVGAGAYVGPQGKETKVQKTPEQIAKDEYQLKQLRESHQKVFGNQKDFKMPSDKELVDMHNQSVANSGMYVTKGVSFGKTKQDWLTNTISGGTNTVGGLEGQGLKLLGADGGDINFEELNKKIGEKGVKTTKILRRNVDDPDFPGSYTQTITPNEGKPFTILVKPDKDTEAFFGAFSDIYKSSLSGKNIRVKKGEVVYKTYNASKPGGGFVTKVEVISPAGTEEMSLEDFSKSISNKYDDIYAKKKKLTPSAYITNREEKDIVAANEEEED